MMMRRWRQCSSTLVHSSQPRRIPIPARFRQISYGSPGWPAAAAAGCAGGHPFVAFRFVKPAQYPLASSFCSPPQAQARMSTASSSSSSSSSYGGRAESAKSQATLMYLVALVAGMVGCSYAAVPLYRKFCQATGYGGTVQRRETIEEKIARNADGDAVATRELVVQFNADVADGMPWRFIPTQREVKVRPGQSTLAFYTAENLSDKAITGVSTYNVSPMKAGIYFNKIQCFCFEEQRLLPGEKIDMPVFFYIDPEFGTDRKMDDINSLVLSYTFFKVESDE